MNTQVNPLGGGAAISGTAASGSSRRIKDTDGIFEELVDVEYTVYERRLQELVEIGYLTREVDDDEDRTYYRAREGLSWSDVARLDCSAKKQILLCLIDNPRTFFILYNTQKGKSVIVAREIKIWAASDKKVVSFLIADNDKSLAEQTASGLIDEIKTVAHVFTLSSNTKVSFDEIRTYIDAYAADSDGEYTMPVVVALNNTDQVKKVLKLMHHIKLKVETRGSPLRYGVVFDEADKVYPPMRSREFALGNGVASSFKTLLVDNDIAVHRLGFVTATDGVLLDAEYEECANAHMYNVPLGDDNYRAIHLQDAIIKHSPHRRQDNNDIYAEQIIASNKDYFKGTITLKNGSSGYRKVIVNGGSRTLSMKTFATQRVQDGWNAMTLNMLGVTVYRSGTPEVRRPSKGVPLGKLLYSLYTELGLHDKPLIIIGRRKVDRGLGFHFAPRDGSDGLIWTDMILGRIEDKNTAVQKAGRLAGVVAQCPQYPGQLTWWTDERTANTIAFHNQIVDVANTQRGCSMLQAVTKATASVEKPQETPKVANFKISRQTFDTVDDAKKWWKDPISVETEPHDVRFGITRYNIYDGPEGKSIKYRGGLRRILTEVEARNSQTEIGGHITNSTPARIMPVIVSDIQWGIATAARIMPVEVRDTMIKYIVIYKPDAVYTPRAPRAAGSGDSSSVVSDE